MKSTSRLTTAAVLALGLAGCAGGRPLPGPSLVTIHFKENPQVHRNCPIAVTVEPLKQCSELFGKKADCLATLKGQKVVFVARQDDKPDARAELEFSVDFDPFKQGNNQFKGDKDHRLELTLDPRSPPKAYTYNVFSGDCPVLDPTIIIRD